MKNNTDSSRGCIHYSTTKLKKHLLGANFLPAELIKFVPLFVDFGGNKVNM